MIYLLSCLEVPDDVTNGAPEADAGKKPRVSVN
jgi:hypothetical protein